MAEWMLIFQPVGEDRQVIRFLPEILNRGRAQQVGWCSSSCCVPSGNGGRARQGDSDFYDRGNHRNYNGI